MLQTLHEDPKESYQLVENGHPMTPLKDLEFNSTPLPRSYAILIMQMSPASTHSQQLRDHC